MKPTIKKLWMLMAMLWVSIAASAYDFEADGIYYKITSMSDLEVGVTSGSTNYTGDITIPETVDYNNRTYTVTSIEVTAFEEDNITSISLPSTISIIKNSAFYNCYNLSQIEFPTSLKEIGNQAFASCYKLQSVILGQNISKVGDYAFQFCSALLEVFCTAKTKPEGLSTSTFRGAHSALEIYVPSKKAYGFGKEYVTFPTASFDYSGQAHNIEWNNNLKAYKCEIAEYECRTEINAGQYTKYLKATYSNGVDFSVDIPYSYTIDKAPMTLTVNNVQREYGEPNPTFTCEISGFVNGENEQTLGTTPNFECTATQMSKAGDYRILASINTPNYAVSYKYGTLSVIKAPLTVTVGDANKIYGNQNPDFSLSYSGLKNNETAPEWSVKPKISTSATTSSSVGQYEVKASDATAVNYEVTKYNSGTLTIAKRDLTAKAHDYERFYDEENPPFEISYIGFVNGDSESSLIKKPIAECSATKTSNARTYSIVVSGGEAENYNFIYQDGTLKIKPLNVGFKDTYSSVTYSDMTISTSELYFNYIPKIEGPYNEDDFWLELWYLDKDNTSSQHVTTIPNGDYAGNYVNTNVDRPMWAGKYIFNLKSKGTNPNVTANPSRAYLTVNRGSNNLEWDATSPIKVKVGEKVDLGISYQADLWCTFSTDYNQALISVSSEGETGYNPHWYATGLSEGETTLYFKIECRKNDMGFYDFADSKTLSKRIVVEPASGIDDVTAEQTQKTVVGRYDSCGRPVQEDFRGFMIVKYSDGTYKKILNR